MSMGGENKNQCVDKCMNEVNKGIRDVASAKITITRREGEATWHTQRGGAEAGREEKKQQQKNAGSGRAF